MKAGSSTDWMSSGGAYWFMGAEILLSALFFTGAAFYLGKIAHSENDGCLLALVNILAAACGGGIGFWMAHYPTFVLTTLGGTLALPMLVTLVAAARFRRQRMLGPSHNQSDGEKSRGSGR